MQPWALLQFAFALAVVIGCLALIIGQLHIIERVEGQKWLNELKENIR